MDVSTKSSTPLEPQTSLTQSKLRVAKYLFALFVFFASVVGVSAIIAANSIPSIANINDCFTTSMFQVDLCPKKSTYVRYGNLPRHLVASLIAAEDATFFFHKGFDWEEIQDSLEKSMDAGRWVRGGSTITQQLAKNLYLSKEKSLMRKLKEFFIAKQIEKKLTKPQIIEKYLNVVEFGKNIYGIQKAAYHYFQKSASALSPAESAYLVSLLPNPIKYSTAFNASKELSRFNKRRVANILYILKVQGKISEEEYNYEVARAEIGLWTPYNPDVMFTVDEEGNETPSDEERPEAQEEMLEEAPALEGDFE